MRSHLEKSHRSVYRTLHCNNRDRDNDTEALATRGQLTLSQSLEIHQPLPTTSNDGRTLPVHLPIISVKTCSH